MLRCIPLLWFCISVLFFSAVAAHVSRAESSGNPQAEEQAELAVLKKALAELLALHTETSAPKKYSLRGKYSAGSAAVIAEGFIAQEVDDTTFIRAVHKAWLSRMDSNASLSREQGLSAVQAELKEYRRLFTDLDMFGEQTLSIVDSIKHTVTLPAATLIAAESFSQKKNINGSAASSPDGKYYLLCDSGTIVVYDAATDKELWRATNSYYYGFFWYDTVIAVGILSESIGCMVKYDAHTGKLLQRMHEENSDFISELHELEGLSSDGRWAAFKSYGAHYIVDLRDLVFANGSPYDDKNLEPALRRYGIVRGSGSGTDSGSGGERQLYETVEYFNANALFMHGMSLAPAAQKDRPAIIRDASGRQWPLVLPPNYPVLSYEKIRQFIFSPDRAYFAALAASGRHFVFSLSGDGPHLYGAYDLSGRHNEDPSLLLLMRHPVHKRPQAILRLGKATAEDNFPLFDDGFSTVFCSFDGIGMTHRYLRSSLLRIKAVAEYEDDKILIAFADGSIRAVDMQSGKVKDFLLPAPMQWTRILAVPGGRAAILFSKDKPYALELATGKLKMLPFAGHAVTGACFSADGRFFFAGTAGGEIYQVRADGESKIVARLNAPSVSMVSDSSSSRLWFLLDAEVRKTPGKGTVTDLPNGRLRHSRMGDTPDQTIQQDSTIRLGVLDVDRGSVKEGPAVSASTEIYWDAQRDSPLAIVIEKGTDLPRTGKQAGELRFKGFNAWTAGGLNIFRATWHEDLYFTPGPSFIYTPSRRHLFAPALIGQDYCYGVGYTVTQEGLGARVDYPPFHMPPFASVAVADPNSGSFLMLDQGEGGKGENFALINAKTGSVMQSPVNRVFRSLPVNGTVFSKNLSHLVTWSSSGLLTLWDISHPKAKAALNWIFFTNGNRVVMDAAFRFDTADADALDMLHWISADRPGIPIPFDAFMRDYYQPGLAEYIIKGNPLPKVPDLSTRNTFQHQISIRDIRRTSPDRVEVEADIHGLSSKQPIEDIKLFRNRQLVAVNTGKLLRPDASGKATVVFKDIPLPQKENTVAFKVYGFNADRVRSSVAQKQYTNIGVNEFDNPAWNLKYAVNDARSLSYALNKAFAPYMHMRTFRLTTDKADIAPTKANIEAMLKALAKPLPGAPAPKKPLRVEPDDMLIISIASHGLTVDNEFYIVPKDIASGPSDSPEFLGKAISMRELGGWLRNVQAREIVLVLDTCQSGASVSGSGFKPGPMGDRGFGQLVYDKGMRVICATNENTDALEDGSLRHGLLSYALLAGLADFTAGKKKSFSTKSWLTEARDQTIPLYEAARKGEGIKTLRGAVWVSDKLEQKKGADAVGQEPRLFDYGVKTLTVRASQ